MAYHTNVMLGFATKLQPHISRGTLPQRPSGGLDIGDLLGACALERRTVASKFKIQNSEFIISLAVFISKKIHFLSNIFFKISSYEKEV